MIQFILVEGVELSARASHLLTIEKFKKKKERKI